MGLDIFSKFKKFIGNISRDSFPMFDRDLFRSSFRFCDPVEITPEIIAVFITFSDSGSNSQRVFSTSSVFRFFFSSEILQRFSRNSC